ERTLEAWLVLCCEVYNAALDERKAEEAGRQVVKVNPAYTSQTCSACGRRQSMPLSVRVYVCPQCGLVIHRDHNGSKNILANARQACGRAGRVIPEAPGLEPCLLPTFWETCLTSGSTKQRLC